MKDSIESLLTTQTYYCRYVLSFQKVKSYTLALDFIITSALSGITATLRTQLIYQLEMGRPIVTCQ